MKNYKPLMIFLTSTLIIRHYVSTAYKKTLLKNPVRTAWPGGKVCSTGAKLYGAMQKASISDTAFLNGKGNNVINT